MSELRFEATSVLAKEPQLFGVAGHQESAVCIVGRGVGQCLRRCVVGGEEEHLDRRLLRSGVGDRIEPVCRAGFVRRLAQDQAEVVVEEEQR